MYIQNVKYIILDRNKIKNHKGGKEGSVSISES